ncbi:MAG: rhomboid family intramembrane serine protease [Elusimicrobiota bacterium]
MSPRVFSHEPINFRHMPPAIKALVIANVAVFLLSNIVGDRFFDLFGLVPHHVLSDRWIWQPLTYLFIHGGILHLVFNLFALWMFGMPVESQWGQDEFFKYYFICGLGAAAASLALSPDSLNPVIGASGPVYGLLVAFAMLYPDAVVYLYFLIPVKAAHMAIIFGLIEFFAGATSATPGVARFAHLGGMVTGYIYIRWWWVIKLKARAAWRGLSTDLSSPGDPRSPKRSSRAKSGGLPQVEAPSAMDEVDRILDKILVSGLDSLTQEERDVMRRYSDRKLH